jgi:hypothetical protein
MSEIIPITHGVLIFHAQSQQGLSSVDIYGFEKQFHLVLNAQFVLVKRTQAAEPRIFKRLDGVLAYVRTLPLRPDASLRLVLDPKPNQKVK